MKENKLTTKVTNYESKRLFDAEGKELGGEATEAVTKRYRKIMMAVREERRGRRKRGDKDRSVQAAIDSAAEAEDWTPRQRHLLGYSVVTEIEHEYAGDAADLSLLHSDDDETVRGEDVMIHAGYDQVVRILAEGVDVKMQHVVSEVEHGKDGVTVKTDQGVFQADRSIVTLPLGVLKAGKVTFKPALPKPKLAAIQRLGMGVYNRVVLQFSKAFWGKEAQVLGYAGPKKAEWAEWYDLTRITDKPMLVGFNAGSFGKSLEALEDKVIIDGALTVLRKLFGKDVPAPEGTLLTRWTSVPFAGGSYSYIALGATLDDREKLMEPVADRLFFAGEATSVKWSATVHGAIRSGVREAKRLLMAD